MHRFGTGLVIAVALGFAACASAPSQPHSTETSGFLGDYSLLQKGGEDEALLVYRRPGASLAGYDKVLLDPITVWASERVEVPEDELQGLVDYLDHSMRSHLGTQFQLVDRAGPNTLRIRIAITEASDSNAVMGTVSSVLPQARLLSGAKQLATGTAAFVGKAGIEGEVVDSLTGVRLFAAVDRRAGQTGVKGATTAWNDVKLAFDFWSKRLTERLAASRAGEVAP
jgi:hypothetical protein